MRLWLLLMFFFAVVFFLTANAASLFVTCMVVLYGVVVLYCVLWFTKESIFLVLFFVFLLMFVTFKSKCAMASVYVCFFYRSIHFLKQKCTENWVVRYVFCVTCFLCLSWGSLQMFLLFVFLFSWMINMIFFLFFWYKDEKEFCLFSV